MVQAVNVLVVTGSRHGCTGQQYAVLRREIAAYDCVMHGGADGVDREADQLARELDKDLIVLPALWTPRGKKAGPIRNSLLADVACALRDDGHSVRFAAFPAPDSTGTHDCIKKLKAFGIDGVYEP